MRIIFSFAILCMLLISTCICFSQGLVIKATRTISFNTDEGSYMDVNVSPDGKMIVFTLLGDLYLVSTSGGKAKQLTRGLALNLRPVWSPDGKKIAFISDFSGALHLNVRDISGKFHIVLGKSDPQLHPEKANPIWSPDGNYIYVADDKGYIRHAYGLAGGKIELTSKQKFFSIHQQWGFYMESGALNLYDLLSGKSEKMDSIGKYQQNLKISPDCRWLVYTVDSEVEGKRILMVKDLLNQSSHILVSSLFVKTPYIPEYQSQQAYSISSDSKFVYIGYGGKIHRINIETREDSIIPFVADVKADLGPMVYYNFSVNHDSLQVKYIRSANLSPDGKSLVFMALSKLYIKDVPGGKPRQLVFQSGVSQFQPVYSPDGKWIAYVSWCDTTGGQLWRVPAVGGIPEQLTHKAGQYQRPAWSPDGKTIAVVRGGLKFNRGKYGDLEVGKLILVNVNDHGVSVVDDEMIPLWNQIGFSENGSRVIYQPKDYDYLKRPVFPNDSLKPRLVSRDLNGQNQRVLALGSSLIKEPHYFQQRAMSPDGRYIVYTMREDLYLVPLCAFSESSVIFDNKQQISMIRFAPGVDPHWEKKGKALAWTYGNKFYRVNPDKILVAAQQKIATGYAGKGLVKIEIEPDQIISIDLKVSNHYGKGTIALKNIRVLTMEKGEVIERGVIIIKDGRFVEVGSVGSVRIPKDAKIMDLSGMTVMPGMIDMHMHVNCRENVYPMQRPDYLANLVYGVTTGRDPASSFDSFGAGELIASGESIGPRLFTVGRAIFQYSDFKFDSFEDALAVVKKRKLLGATYVKQYGLPSRLQKQWLLIACKKYGLNMTNEGLDFLTGNIAFDELSMIKDGSTGVEHNPDWGDVYKDLIMFFAKSGCFIGETLGVGYGPGCDSYFNYTSWRQSNEKLDRFAATRFGNGFGEGLVEFIRKYIPDSRGLDSLFRFNSKVNAKITTLGGRITLGGHGSQPIGVTTHGVLWALQMGGISNMEVLKQATIRGAEALGMQKDLGSVKVGKIADLIILNKNPLENIHNSREIRYLMKDGVLYDGNTLDQLWPVFKKCPHWKIKKLPD